MKQQLTIGGFLILVAVFTAANQLGERVPGIPEVKVGRETYVTVESNGAPVWRLEAAVDDDAEKRAYLEDIAKGSRERHDFANIVLEKDAPIYRRSISGDTLTVEFLIQDGNATYGRVLKLPPDATYQEILEHIQRETDETKERGKR